jgi:hypothetical protein
LGDKIPAELFQAAGEALRYGLHEPIISLWNKEELSDMWKQSVTVPVHKKYNS